jgi:hypothetical protein
VPRRRELVRAMLKSLCVLPPVPPCWPSTP